ncbi:MAG: histidinol dehydrogenase [Chloroflexota bacterium]
MRTVTGYQQGLAALARTPGYAEPRLSPAAAERMQGLFVEPVSASEAVRRIVADVREHGDEALRRWAERLDGADLSVVEVEPQRWASALKTLPEPMVEALLAAAERVRAYHQRSMPQGWDDPNAGYGQRIVPLERVGLYIPGGTAAYPSTVLMTAIPAKVAGVEQVVLCTPNPTPETLAAAHIACVDRLFAVGGAQAIAAMAFGTESVPKVDKICGPGGAFVALAKREVYGNVDIDGLYGPTETVVLADETADPQIAAADLLAQAEHDELASPVLITTSAAQAQAVIDALEQQLAVLERRAVAAAALERQGVAVVVESVEEGISLANAFAPEHLCLLVRDPASYVGLVRNAGGIFVGEDSPEVAGDYVAGPSHTMPTGGTARYASSLGVHTFLKQVPVIALRPQHLRELGRAAAAIARAEGLIGHARAMERRLEGAGEPDKDFLPEDR